ncbi:MAG TPA: serine hydrolase [Streptosporangiaceae bacterium]
MRVKFVLRWAGTVILTGTAMLAPSFVAAAPQAAASTQICQASPVNGQTNTALASKLSDDISTALNGRAGTFAVDVNNPHLGILCHLNADEHFYSASVVKATILGALLHKAEAQGHGLTAHQKSLARAMITVSDNNAATALWNDVGRTWLQKFLDLAHMNDTVLGPGGYWGLTEITAHNESVLLWDLLTPGSLLTRGDQAYELTLMSQVISSERFGVPDGAPSGFTVHVKNGWAPLPSSSDPWYVNSIGCFTRGDGSKDYSIVVLTHQAPSHPAFSYGVTTIQGVAVRVHKDLNGSLAATPAPNPSAGNLPIPPGG